MKEWIYPSIVFSVFVYAMFFVSYYTYKSQATYSGGGSRGGTTNVESLKSEISKKMN